ncbi:TIGR03364 family FAD-dependent oxidoreductase [Leucobacter albus]|uniref:TIGR03364 family FAD-dependent oxidoreductase n=1 Tax=Leucobacter albus TaxID=272210 RepID=A0ABW3TQE3_9MICO
MTSHIAIVGAGIVGLSHAVAALDAGYRVTVIEEGSAAQLASIRNFGHVCTSVQAGEVGELAREANPIWRSLAERAGVEARVSGTLAVARSAAEEAVLVELAGRTAANERELLTAQQVARELRLAEPGAIRAGLMLAGDLTANPRTVVADLAAWVDAHERGEMRFSTSVRGIREGQHLTVETNRGDIAADRVIVATGHLVGRLFPELAEDVRECVLQMARVRAPHDMGLGPAVLSGTSMLRYGAFAGPAQEALRAETARIRPDLLDIGANVMFTQQPDGTLLVGDSHDYFDTAPPFLDERWSELLLADAAALLGAPRLEVLERWQGIYASSSERELLREQPIPGVHVVTVTTGIGMTIGPALGARTIAAL